MRSWGAFPGEDAPHPLGFVDQRPAPDEGYDGRLETNRGVAIWRHPEAILRDSSPQFQRFFRRWQLGAYDKQKPSMGEYVQLNNYEAELLEAARMAYNRELRRREIERKYETGSQ